MNINKIMINVEKDSKVNFNNYVDYCVGTGRMGLALQKEYFEQLKFVQEKIGFKYIRGHGLFHDDMAIYQEYKDKDGNVKVEYNFTYLDFVMDNYKSLGLRPFLELGFMPKKMASGEQTVFYWNGNVTPPRDYKLWNNLVIATLAHLKERYGDEVYEYPVEVWNEPNLAVFWKDADMDEYFKLFKETVLAIKEFDSRFRVGGPAICGVDDENWMRKFLEFCSREKLPLDFITRHHYTIEVPEFDGRYGYVKVTDIENGFATLRKTREITDSFPEFKDFEVHITEFNTSYSPQTPIHDTNYNAAYVAHLLSRLGDDNRSYSYWTFGDIFEESGVPFAPFHGGFGLVANRLIPKPTFWTFEFFAKLKDNAPCERSCNSVIVKNGNGYKGVLWNYSNEQLEIDLQLYAKYNIGYFILKKTVDETCCNPLKIWHDMGEPLSLSSEQVEILRSCSNPFIESKNVNAEENKINLLFKLEKNAVVYFEITEAEIKSDRGFDYTRSSEH